MPRKRALLLVNEQSRRGADGYAGAVELLKRQGLAVIERAPQDPPDIGRLIRHYRERVDCVLIGGGDGTLNAAAGALLETGLPLGILPMGTANDFARTLTIPTDLAAACGVIVGGLLHAIDLGSVNGKHFFNVASMGLSVQCARRLTGEVKRRWGVLGYAIATCDALRASRPFHADIVCDGKRVRLRSIQIAVGNGRHYGGGMTVAEDAAIDDARLDLYSLDPQSIWRLIALVPAMRSGRHGRSPSVQVLHGHRIRIETDRPMRINTDGEVTTRTPAEFAVLPGALSVFVPEGYRQAREEAVRASG